MPDPENPVPPKSSTVFLRNFAKSWALTALGLTALFGAVYLMLWKRYCPGGTCDGTFAIIRGIFGRMLLTGLVIAALGGWGIYRAYNRMK